MHFGLNWNRKHEVRIITKEIAFIKSEDAQYVDTLHHKYT